MPLPLDPAAIAALRTPGSLVPPASLPLVGGSHVRLRADGTITVIVVFAAWCDPCAAIAQAVQSASMRHRNVRFLGIDELESAERAAGFVRKTGVTFPTALLTDTKFSAATVTDEDRGKTGLDIPAVYVIDRSGRATQAFIGPGMNVGAKIDAALRNLR